MKEGRQEELLLIESFLHMEKSLINMGHPPFKPFLIPS